MKALKWQLLQSKLSVLMPCFITLGENFGKWRPYLELFLWGKGTEGPEISLGAVPPDPLLEPPLGGLMFSPRVLSNKIEKT